LDGFMGCSLVKSVSRAAYIVSQSG